MVAAPNPSDETPDEAIDRICREATSPTNEIVGRIVRARFAAWLEQHPLALARRAPNVASTMVNAFFKRRRPKIGAAQLGLFRPEALVPIGDGKQAWMEDLSRDQFQDWEQVETKANGNTNTVFRGKVDYWQDRRDHWGTYQSLGKLERGYYGYVDADISYDDQADDEDDDG